MSGDSVPDRAAAGPRAVPKAVALRYDEGDGAAPRVVARGRGEIAERILAAAAEHDVPVRQDADLLELLAVCDLDEEIPSELYGAVAELLAYLWRLNEELRSAPDASS